MKELMPKSVKNVKKYRGKIPLFHDANIEKELINIYLFSRLARIYIN